MLLSVIMPEAIVRQPIFFAQRSGNTNENEAAEWRFRCLLACL